MVPIRTQSTQNMRTPPDLIAQMRKLWNVDLFDLDVAADETNKIAPEFIDEKRDALKQDWCGAHVFCNPPYKKIQPWVDHGILQVIQGNAKNVYFVLPAQTSTVWFHELAAKSHLVILRRRVAFLRPDGSPTKSPPHGTIISRVSKDTVMSRGFITTAKYLRGIIT